MPAILNAFKTVTANVSTSASTVYTSPTGYNTVLLLAQASNISGNVVTVSARHVRGATKTSIITNATLPVGDAINLLTGKMVLETGDQFEIQGSVNNSAQLILSILETAV